MYLPESSCCLSLPSPPPPPPPPPPVFLLFLLCAIFVLLTSFFSSFVLSCSSNKPGHKVYKQWCAVWEKEYGGTVQPSARGFLADNFLPVWVQCMLEHCHKWRKVPPQVELYQVKQDIVRCSNCDQPEDEVRMCEILCIGVLEGLERFPNICLENACPLKSDVSLLGNVGMYMYIGIHVGLLYRFLRYVGSGHAHLLQIILFYHCFGMKWECSAMDKQVVLIAVIR